MIVLIFPRSKSPTLLLNLWKKGFYLWYISALFLLVSISKRTCFAKPYSNDFAIVEDNNPFPAPNYTYMFCSDLSSYLFIRPRIKSHCT